MGDYKPVTDIAVTGDQVVIGRNASKGGVGRLVNQKLQFS
jgi:hypothetical protein